MSAPTYTALRFGSQEIKAVRFPLNPDRLPAPEPTGPASNVPYAHPTLGQPLHLASPVPVNRPGGWLEAVVEAHNRSLELVISPDDLLAVALLCLTKTVADMPDIWSPLVGKPAPESQDGPMLNSPCASHPFEWQVFVKQAFLAARRPSQRLDADLFGPFASTQGDAACPAAACLSAAESVGARAGEREAAGGHPLTVDTAGGIRSLLVVGKAADYEDLAERLNELNIRLSRFFCDYKEFVHSQSGGASLEDEQELERMSRGVEDVCGCIYALHWTSNDLARAFVSGTVDVAWWRQMMFNRVKQEIYFRASTTGWINTLFGAPFGIEVPLVSMSTPLAVTLVRVLRTDLAREAGRPAYETWQLCGGFMGYACEGNAVWPCASVGVWRTS